MNSKVICALLLWAMVLGGCERLNPSWCDKLGRCAAGQICNPVNNTCESHDATPDILSHVDYPVADAPGDSSSSDATHDGAREIGPAQDLPSEVVDLGGSSAAE